MNGHDKLTKHRHLATDVAAVLLCFLFFYTGLSKLFDWEGTKSGLYNQVFPMWMADMLLFSLPVLEIATSLLLMNPKTRHFGFRISVILMACFSGYIGLVLTGIFGRVPCSCGGVIDTLGWWEHLLFNLVFLGIGLVGWKLGKVNN
jgi:uncharacterized membrane protein YphA (DoxX/SURF4 family)